MFYFNTVLYSYLYLSQKSLSDGIIETGSCTQIIKANGHQRAEVKDDYHVRNMSTLNQDIYSFTILSIYLFISFHILKFLTLLNFNLSKNLFTDFRHKQQPES